jgi:membrane protease YdiL (CAAX protease family)
MLSAIISALLQVGVVLLVAGAVYFAMRRRDGSFLRFIGLFPAPIRAIAAGIFVGLVAAAALLAVPGVARMASGVGTVAGNAVRAGSPALVPGLLIAAVFKTSLSEELLFRGLIGKRLIARLGFQAGNLIQATLFGLVHLLILLVPKVSAGLVAVMVLVTGLMGWFNGWLNETSGRGSILPGWAAHAVANVCAYLYLATIVS